MAATVSIRVNARVGLSGAATGISFNTVSGLDKLLLVVDLLVQLVVVADQVVALEGQFGLCVSRVVGLDLGVQLLPLLVKVLAVLGVLLDGVVLLLTRQHLHRLVEGQRVNLLENGLQSDQGLLQDLVPVVVRKVDDDWDEHGEGPVSYTHLTLPTILRV